MELKCANLRPPIIYHYVAFWFLLSYAAVDWISLFLIY
jgi:hypothetical protein